MSSTGFETVPLAEACHLITDGSHFSPTPREEGHPIVNAKDIPKGRVELDTCTRISERDYRLLKDQNCAPIPDDVLLSKDGTIGRVVHYKEDLGVVLLSSVAIVRPNTTMVAPAFLAHALRSHLFDRQLFRLQSGSALKRLVLGDIRKIVVPVPKSEIQDRIAEILSTVDEAIEQTEALIAKYQQIKAGLMHDLLTRGVTPDGHLRPIQAHAPHLYKESPLGWIPKEWEVVPLSNVSQFITSGSRGWAEYYSEIGPLFIRIGNLTREHINFRWDSVTRVSLPKFTEGQRTAVLPNDILISITADLGIVAVADDGLGEAYVNQHIALVRPRVAPGVSRFLGYFLSTVSVQKQFLRLNDSGAKAGLNLPAIGKILVGKPLDDVEAKGIAAMLDEADQSIECHKREVAKLRQQKHGLMHDLLTGCVRVKVAEPGGDTI